MTKEEIAGALWLALLTSLARDRGALLDKVEHYLGTEMRRAIEAGLKELGRL